MSDPSDFVPDSVEVETHEPARTHVGNQGLDAAAYGDVLSTATDKTGRPLSSIEDVGPDTVVKLNGIAVTLKGLENAGVARRDPQSPGGWSFSDGTPEPQEPRMGVSPSTEQAFEALEPHLRTIGLDRSTFLSTLVGGSQKDRADLVNRLGAAGVPKAGLERFVGQMSQEAEALEDRIAQIAGGTFQDVQDWVQSNGQLTKLRMARTRLLQGDAGPMQQLAKAAADAGRMASPQFPEELMVEHRGTRYVDLRRYGLPPMRPETLHRMRTTGELKQLVEQHGLPIKVPGL